MSKIYLGETVAKIIITRMNLFKIILLPKQNFNVLTCTIGAILVVLFKYIIHAHNLIYIFLPLTQGLIINFSIS
jgi:hypothetical protein